MTGPAPLTIPRGDVSTWGEEFDIADLAERVQLCRDAAATTREKGQRLEQLAIWLLPHIPGFQVRKTDVFNPDHSQEIDILVWNEKMPGGFPSFGENIIVECKNWEGRVDSSDIAWLYWKMRFGGVREAILIAANGITGMASRRRNAQAIVILANAEDPSRRIFVLTLSEIERLTTRDDLRELLIDKSLDLAAQAAFS